MKIVNITGGLGNQMFQYAFAIFLQNMNLNEDVYIDIQHYNSLFFKKFRGINLHNGFEIDKIFPKATLQVATSDKLSKVSRYIPNYVLSRIARKLLPAKKTEYVAPYSRNYSYDNEAVSRIGDVYFEGYWQCVKYLTPIKDVIQDVFSHPSPNDYNATMIEQIQNCCSVGVHVRRGDYLKEPEFNGICGIEYYKKAINDIKCKNEDARFFIFSNDITWCKENLLPLIGEDKAVFITENRGTDSCWDMFLMTYCKRLIIANSSFSWWGAFLNKNVKCVYAPHPWLNRDCPIDLYEDNWVKLSSN